ncbi:colicin E5-related ribonuclease [Pararhizobium sp. YC-54]|uniref:colicin E5-related ribonuclease n=1 Tax=Pararhizobium sp. YC-54 TaxID=2986920 RepID=UPI0021F7761D|nr:colicin E5-related ribonuclease [Pararhizobium sp. YC-54]MCW0001705.1 colicin E5-related ribonuclease [Pararhizobium sp. YC-54]
MRSYLQFRPVLTLFLCSLMIWAPQAEAGKIFRRPGQEVGRDVKSEGLKAERGKEREPATRSEKWRNSELPNKPSRDFRDASKLDAAIKAQKIKRDVIITNKIRDQMAERNWTAKEINDLSKTAPTGKSIDNTGGKRSPATVYGTPSRHIIVSDFTRHVVQISGGVGWKVDPRIQWAKAE